MSGWSVPILWCPTCGVVWADPDRGPFAPICRHGVLDSPTPPRRMEPIPVWHPYSPTKAFA